MAREDISGYSLRRSLGSGSAGTVWLLRDLATGRHAVLKRIPKSTIAVRSDFLRDLDLARTIDHPHIARLLDVRESDREWLLFSQYVAAGTLTSLLERRGPLSPGELVTLITPLAQALATLHRTGLTHGHLTLNDIMFDADGRPVITDPGLRSLTPKPPHQPTPAETPTPAATPTPEADLAALATITHQSGGTPQTFPPSLFTTTPDHLARHALHHAHPLPINLSFPPTPAPPASANPASPQFATPTPSNVATPTPSNVATPTPSNLADSALPQLATPAPPNSANPTSPQLATPTPSNLAHPTPPNLVNAASPQLAIPTPPISHPTPATSHPTPAASRELPTRDRGRDRLTSPTHRRSASRQSKRLPAHQSASQAALRLLRTKRGAYGILAACGAGAVATVLIGLTTLGILDHPATAATADQSTQPQPTPTTPQPTANGPQLTPTTPGPTPKAPKPTPTTPQPTPSGSRATSATPPATTHQTTKQWLQTLQSLDARRSDAFATLNPAALNTVYLPGSPPWSADRALLTSYRDQHLRIEGLRLHIQSVSIETPGRKTVVLRIVDRLVAGTAITASGQRTPFPPGRPTARRVTLTVTTAATATATGTTTAATTSWRISAIAKA